MRRLTSRCPAASSQSFIDRSVIDAYIETDRPVIEVDGAPITDIHQRIATQVITLIDDGATLQLGIESVADAVLQQLFDHKELGSTPRCSRKASSILSKRA